MQIGGVEARIGAEAVEVEDVEALAGKPDQAVVAELRQHAIGMHGRNPERVGKLFLRQRELEAVVLREADRFEADQELAEQVRHLLVGRAPAHADEPLAQDALVDKRVPPQRADDRRVLLGEHGDCRLRDEGDRAGRERADAVVHRAEDRDVEVADVARDEEGHDLALPVGKRLVAAGEALEDQVHLVRPVALADEVLARADLAHVGDRLLDGAPVVLGQLGAAGELPDQRVEHGSSPDV